MSRILRLDIPGGERIDVARVVSDFNGTLALDGRLIDAVRERLVRLAAIVPVHILTSDSHGSAKAELAGLPVVLEIVANGADKASRVARLGVDTIAIGNGGNDLLMMQEARLAIGVVGPEGLAAALVAAADVIVMRPRDALDLLLRPSRLTATLRR